VTQPIISNRWELVFEVTGWQRPIISNLRGSCQKGSIFDNHPQNDHVYSNIHMYIRIYKFDILGGANFEYAVTSNLAATDPAGSNA
jgi:hypothetical protein